MFLVMKIEKKELDMKIRLRLDLLELVQNIHFSEIIHNYFALHRQVKNDRWVTCYNIDITFLTYT